MTEAEGIIWMATVGVVFTQLDHQTLELSLPSQIGSVSYYVTVLIDDKAKYPWREYVHPALVALRETMESSCRSSR